MLDHTTSIDKLTIPSVQGAVPRPRLFRTLSQNKKGRIHWVSAPAGAGKTTLVASYIHDYRLPCLWYHMDGGDNDPASFFYFLRKSAEQFGTLADDSLPLLTPEYSFGIQTFFIRFFEKLTETLPRGACLVFDNYHHLPASSALHELIVQGLEVAASTHPVIVISRAEPPSSFARLAASGMLSHIGWPDLRLSNEETREVVRKAAGRNVTDDMLAHLQAASEGWAAGIVLMLESLKNDDARLDLPEHLTLIQIFDYLAGEVFDKSDPTTQQVLLLSSLLPVAPGALADKITGIPGAEGILARFGRNHFFTEKLSEPVTAYRFHSLFRQFLSTRARASLAGEKILDVQRSAALMLRQSGLIEDAALLWRECGDWDALSLLIMEEAPELMSQGRAATLAAWIEVIPDEMRHSRPWLLYWQGIVDLLRDLQLARSRLELAYRSFRQQGDVAGIYLAWSGVIDTYTYEWSDFAPLDEWIAELDAVRRLYPEFPAPEIDARVTAGIFCALMYRQPQHVDLPLWEDRLKHILLEGKADTHLRVIMSSHLLLYYMWWIGDLSKAAIVIKTLRQGSGKSGAASLPAIIWSGIEAGYHWMTAETGRCVKSATEGLQEADKSGIHLWDFMLCAQGVYGTLSAGDGAQAAAFLARMEASINPGALQHSGHYHFLAAWEALSKGHASLAEEHARTAHRLVERAGTPFTLAASKFGLGEVLIERGEIAQALPCLEDALAIGRAIRSRTTEFQALIRIAYALFRQGETGRARQPLADAFAIGRAQGYFNFAWWRPQMITRLCCEALDAGIEREYVRELIVRRRPSMALPEVAQEGWPWELMIHTLGRFEVVINGQPLTFEGRVQQMPLNLLKAVIAFGGTNVPQEKLEHALWPDSEGDAAHTAFGTNLHRLRKLLGRDDFIQMQNGLVSLDARRVWVDLRAFEQLTGSGEGGIPLADAKRAIALYHGHPFPGDQGKAWTIASREMAKARFRRAIMSIASDHERTGNWSDAVWHYERGLELDEVAEAFYLNLMNCHLKLGERAKALSVYERCSLSLAATLEVQPSAELQRLARHIRNNS